MKSVMMLILAVGGPRIVEEADRHPEDVHLKNMQAASFEPRQQLSGAEYREGLGFYRSTTDAAMHLFSAPCA